MRSHFAILATSFPLMLDSSPFGLDSDEGAGEAERGREERDDRLDESEGGERDEGGIAKMRDSDRCDIADGKKPYLQQFTHAKSGQYDVFLSF